MFNELVQKAKYGDQVAMEEIIKKLQPLLVSSIRRYYNKAEEYEDLMQDGNIKIMESVYDYDMSKGAYFLGYIKMNIKYLYLDKHKIKYHESLNKTLGNSDLEHIDLLVSEDVDFLKNIIDEEENLELIKALSILTLRQREVINLFYGNRLSIGKIAEELGVAYRTVVNTKTKALEKMRKNLIKIL